MESSARLSRSAAGARLYLFLLFAALTVAGVLVPIGPVMPSAGLDASWVMAMNAAVVRHLAIGRDLIFTLGPFAALYSHLYDPGLDRLMMIAGGFLATAYVLALARLAGSRPKWEMFVLLVLLGWFGVMTDAIFFSYFMLMALLLYQEGEAGQARETSRSLAVWAVLTVPLGLLPLIKGNQIPMVMIMDPLFAAVSLRQRKWASAVVCAVVPIVSMFGFWLAAGQPLAALGSYLSTSMQLLGGYTEAMSFDAHSTGHLRYVLLLQPWFYAAVALMLLASIGRKRAEDVVSRIFLVLSFALFLFVGFKSGFVRYDAHVWIAGSTLILAGLFACLLRRDGAGRIAIAAGLLIMILVQAQYRFGVPGLVRDALGQSREKSGISATSLVEGVYGNVVNGLWARLHPGALERRYQASMAAIRDGYHVLPDAGDADIYPVEQSILLASGVVWNPRPVMQSYSAWTPGLLERNEAHLRGAGAPQTILFEAGGIDRHPASLEDGVSWMALLDNYVVRREDDRFVYLVRNGRPPMAASSLTLLQDEQRKTGENVPIGPGAEPLFVLVDLEPTLFGKLANTLYKLPEVSMRVTLRDGSARTYHVLPEMMRTGFFLSPSISTTQQFEAFVRGERSALVPLDVTSMAITPSSAGLHEWRSSYRLRLERYQGGAWKSGQRR